MTAATAKQFKTQLSFESVNALVFDPIATNRATTRTALGMLGFRQVTATSVLEELAQLVRGRVFDLLVADVTHEPSKICGVVRSIREGQAGPNPFLHIVLMAWKLEGDLVHKALNCGADDLVTRPFSVDFLGARIRSHTESRKQFVVTSDYIGPDRRPAPSKRPSANAIDVPNTLLAKARESHSADRSSSAMMDEIKAACFKIDAERARKDAFQVSFLLHFLRDALTSMAPLEKDLKRLETVARDLVDRVHGVEAEAIHKLATPLLQEIAAAQSGEHVAAHLEKMESMTTALLEAMYPERPKEEVLQEVQAAVATVKGRGRKDQNTA